MIRRIWVFSMSAPSQTARNLFLERIAWLHLTDVAFYVNGKQDRTFRPSVTRVRRIEETASRLKDQNVDTHLVTWLRPSRTYMDRCAAFMRPFCERIGARSMLFDTEEPWKLNVRGEAGARAIVEQHWPFYNWPCYLGVSDITYMPDAVKPVAEKCHYTLPQAYSVGNQRGGYRRYIVVTGFFGS